MNRKQHKNLIANNLCKQFGNKSVVKGVDLNVKRGEVVGLLGPNGAGKTTSFYMITGMIKPTEGKVFLDDFDITGDPMYIRSQKGIGYLSQEPSIFALPNETGSCTDKCTWKPPGGPPGGRSLRRQRVV